MAMVDPTLKNEERIVFQLRSLYHTYGYSQYKMSKFEEYDLYAQNKDFLKSDGIITFTDTNGRLMALKPDVTLSIVRNSRPAPRCVQKVYYHENVYRVSQQSHSFREITHVGVECIGDVDPYCVAETLLLASKSLSLITENWRLCLSHLDILSCLIDRLGVPEVERGRVLSFVEGKNLHELNALCRGLGCPEDAVRDINALLSLSGDPDEAIAFLSGLNLPDIILPPFIQAVEVMREAGVLQNVSVDFSIVGDMAYYNGFVFKGFVSGVPAGVLSGGQYDRLLSRMGKSSRGIGFAVYLDLLERLGERAETFDADMLILYDDGADVKALSRTVSQFTALGVRAVAQKTVPDGQRFKQIAHFSGSGVEILDSNA